MKIWLASYPRSGKTYFRILVHHYTGWPTYSWKPESIIPEGSRIGKAHTMTAYTPGEPPDTPAVAGFLKTHEYQDDGVPAVLLLRDGRDSIVSYAKYLKAFQSELFKDHTEERLITDLILGTAGYEMWGSFTRRWMDREPPAVILPFERLIGRNPLRTLKWVFKELNLPEPEWITVKDPPGFEELHEINPKFFRKGTHDQWLKGFTEDQVAQFQRYHIAHYDLEDYA